MGNRSGCFICITNSPLCTTTWCIDIQMGFDLVKTVSFQSDLIDLCVFRLPLGYQQEYDSTHSIVVMKFLVSNILLFGYTCQLCLTTVCTPSIYFDWFLLVTDCRYVYSYLL